MSGMRWDRLQHAGRSKESANPAGRRAFDADVYRFFVIECDRCGERRTKRTTWPLARKARCAGCGGRTHADLA